MPRDTPPSIVALIRETLAALCPLHIGRLLAGWADEPQPIPIRRRDPDRP